MKIKNINVNNRAQETRLVAFNLIEELNGETFSLTRTWRTAFTIYTTEESKPEVCRRFPKLKFLRLVSFSLEFAEKYFLVLLSQDSRL